MVATYNGTNGDDVVTSGFDYMYGGDGNDTLTSDQGGTDVVEGGRGNDTVHVLTGVGAFGNLYGGDGSDTVFGAENADRLYGGEGNDYILGSNFTVSMNPSGVGVSGSDYMEGGAGVDAMYGFDGNDIMYGGDGNEAGVISTNYGNVNAGMYGGDGNDYIDGGRGNDFLYGGAGNDRLLGGDGNDILDAGAGVGTDIMFGGDGNDIYYQQHSDDAVVETTNGGFDVVLSFVNASLSENVEELDLLGGATVGVSVTSGYHLIRGNDLANIIVAQNGEVDMYGGAGNDLYDLTRDNNSHRIFEDAGPGGGYDIVYSTVSTTLAENVEELHLRDGAAVVALGNSGANFIFGNSGLNVLNGFGGNDSLTGGGGTDIFQFSQTNFGHDTITDFVHATDNISFSTSIFGNFAALDGHIAQSGSDTLILFNGATDYITLTNVQASTLTAADFSFF